jgi:TatD DNase family protein
MLIDTHAHLYSEEFNEDLDEMMQRAFDAGVSRFYLPAIDVAAIPSMKEIESKYPREIYLMMGLHPCYVKENFETELEKIHSELLSRPFAAVGEIGIDLYWDKTNLKAQQMAFRSQIRWAKELKLPIVIHCREAFDEIFEVLETEKSPDLYGIFHCFSGNIEQAKQAISYQMKLGIGGVVTFKNGKIDQFLAEIGLEHLVLETDAPYLAPVPFRGKRNESSYLKYVVEKLSTIYGLSIDEIAKKTSENALSIFNNYK